VQQQGDQVSPLITETCLQQSADRNLLTVDHVDTAADTHHEGVGLGGEGPVLGAADANAELHRTAWRVREQSLGHVAHNPTHTQEVRAQH